MWTPSTWCSPTMIETLWAWWPKSRRPIGNGDRLSPGADPRVLAPPGQVPGRPSVVEAQAELVEPSSHGVRRHPEQARDGPYVARPDGDQLAVEVLALHLDHAHEPADQVAFGTAHVA